MARRTHLSKKTLYSALGGQLAEARQRAGRTQAELAGTVGCSVPAVRRSERGGGSSANYLGMADALGLWLVGRSLPPGESLGERLQNLRKRRGLGRRALAEISRVSVPTIAGIEAGAPCHLAALERTAEALGAGLGLASRGVSPGFWAGAGTSSAHHGWVTPPDLLEALYGVVGRFDLDPCSPSADARTAPVRSRMRYTAADDGLALPWRGQVFVNPPYGRQLALWIAKCREEVEAGRADLVICLVPARTDTRWWHVHIAGRADIGLLKGRLAFGDGTQPAPFASALVAWGCCTEQRHRLQAAFPSAWWIPADFASPVDGVAASRDNRELGSGAKR
jgi:transcriptional regulator with XRE-family HTH domain